MNFEQVLNRAKAEWNRVQQNQVKLLPQVIPPEVVRNSPKNGCVWNWVALLPPGLKIQFDDNPKRTANQNKRIISDDGSFVNSFRKINQLPGYEDQVYQCVSKPWAQAVGLLRNKAQIQEIGDQKKETSVWWVEDDEEFRRALERTGKRKVMQRPIRPQKQEKRGSFGAEFRRRMRGRKVLSTPEPVLRDSLRAKPDTAKLLDQPKAPEPPVPAPIPAEERPKRRIKPNMIQAFEPAAETVKELPAPVLAAPVPTVEERPKRRIKPNLIQAFGPEEAVKELPKPTVEPASEKPVVDQPRKSSPKPVPSAVMNVSKPRKQKSAKDRNIEQLQWLQRQVEFWTKQKAENADPKIADTLKSYEDRLEQLKSRYKFPDKPKPLTEKRIKEQRSEANNYRREINKIKKQKVLNKPQIKRLKKIQKKLEKLEREWPGLLEPGPQAQLRVEPKSVEAKAKSPQAEKTALPKSPQAEKAALPKSPQAEKSKPKRKEEDEEDEKCRDPTKVPPAVPKLRRKELKKLTDDQLNDRAQLALDVFNYIQECQIDNVLKAVEGRKKLSPENIASAQRWIDAASDLMAGQREYDEEYCRVIEEVEELLGSLSQSARKQIKIDRFTRVSKRWLKECKADQEEEEEELDTDKPLALIELVSIYTDFAQFLTQIWELKQMEQYKDLPKLQRIDKYSDVKKSARAHMDETLWKLWSASGLAPELLYVVEILAIKARSETDNDPEATARRLLSEFANRLDSASKANFKLLWDKDLYEQRQDVLQKLQIHPSLETLQSYSKQAAKASEEIDKNGQKFVEKFQDQERKAAQGDVEKWQAQWEKAYADFQQSLGRKF